MRAALLALLLALPTLGHARCASGGLSVWPPPGTALPAQGYVLLEGFGTEQTTVTQLGDGQAWLVSSRGEAVPLTIAAVHAGFLNTAQAVLQPARPLAKGTWRLELGPAQARRAPRIWGGDGRGPASWPVAGAEEAGEARWTGEPTAEPGRWAELGCGPAISTTVRVPAEGRVLAIVTLVRGESGGRWWLPVEGGTISLGHGMCTGPFDVRGPGLQTARIRLVPAGGGAPQDEKVVRFPGPVAPTR